MAEITVYEKPTCSTCRTVNRLLSEQGIDFEKVNYYIDAISESKLQDLLKKMQIPASELIRKKEDIYKELGLKDKELSEHEYVSIMVKYPDLIQRPIVERGAKAVLARPPEKLKEIL